MAFKTVTYKVRGMKQDISESAFDSDYSFENMNIRIDNRNNNTLLSIEQEMGNKQIIDIKIFKDLNYTIYQQSISELPFFVLGHCEIDKYLVLFGKSNSGDHIARLELRNDGTWCLVYIFKNASLNFDYEHPIETLGCVETEQIKKVYFVDGISPLRKVNIVDTNSINNYSLLESSVITGIETMTVTKDWNRTGHYPHGKVQFAFNYETDLEVTTNLIEISPLFDCTNRHNCMHTDDEAYAEHSFHITINGLNTEFKWINVFIFHWTSDGNPVIKKKRLLIDNSGVLSFDIDFDEETVVDYTGSITDLIKSTVGMIPLTMATKDNYLFLGNIKYGIPIIDRKITEDDCTTNFELKTIGQENYFHETNTSDVMMYDPFYTTYKGSNYDYMGYRKDNWYKFGIIAQHKSGQWSNVIPTDKDFKCDISSKSVMHYYDNSLNTADQLTEHSQPDYIEFKIPRFHLQLSSEFIDYLKTKGFVKIKPVCVVPSPEIRTVLTQGIACPTLYRGEDRVNTTEGGAYSNFSFGSYFFRPYCGNDLFNIDVEQLSFSPKYSYTLRSVKDLIISENIFKGKHEHTGKPIINTNPKFDKVREDLVHLNSPYREYRHGFSLPPKNTINAELESSNTVINEYFWEADSKLFDLSEDNPTYDTIEPSIQGEIIENIASTDKLHTGNYKQTIFVDSTINTLNTPEIEYGALSELNFGIHDIIDYLNNSKVEVCGYAQVTGSYSNIDIDETEFTTPYEQYATSSRKCTLADGYSHGKSISNILNNQDLDKIQSLFLKKKTNYSGVFSCCSGPFWFDNKLVLRSRTKIKNLGNPTNDNWNRCSCLHAYSTPTDTVFQGPLTGYYVGGYKYADDVSLDYYYIPTENVDQRDLNSTIYGYRDSYQLNDGLNTKDNMISADATNRIVATSWGGELMSSVKYKITCKNRSILTCNYDNTKERPYFLSEFRIGEGFPIAADSNPDSNIKKLRTDSYYFILLGLSQHLNYTDSDSDDKSLWGDREPYNFDLPAFHTTWGNLHDDDDNVNCTADSYYKYRYWAWFNNYYKNILYGGCVGSYYFDPVISNVTSDNEWTIEYPAGVFTEIPRINFYPWILPYNPKTNGYSYNYDTSSTINFDGTNYQIATPHEYGCHVYMPFSTTFPHSAFDPYYAHAIYPFMHTGNLPFNGVTTCYSDSYGGEYSYGLSLRPEYNETTSFLYSGPTNYINVESQPETTKQLYYNHEVDNGSLKRLDLSYNINAFYNKPEVHVQYRTQSLTSAMKWYRGFSTLKNKLDEDNKLLCLGLPLSFSNFIGNTAFSGQLPQLYTKNGSCLSYSTDTFSASDYVVIGDNEEIYKDVADYLFQEQSCEFDMNYTLSPHIVFYTKDLNYTLPQATNDEIIVFKNQTVQLNKLKPEFYYKYFSNENILKGRIFDIHNNYFPNITADNVVKTIYPHTGTWKNLAIGLFNRQNIAFWENVNHINAGSLNRPICQLKDLGYNKNDFCVRTEDMDLYNSYIGGTSRKEDDYWFLNIANLINTNRDFSESPYEEGSNELYVWKECGNSVSLVQTENTGIDVYFDEGDTYFQRYNCVKTYYDKANKQKNGVAETASVMIESYINLDGVTFKNIYNTTNFRQLNPYNRPTRDTMSNLINPVYSKQNTLVTHHEVNFNMTNSTLDHYPTLIMWSNQKIFGNEMDYWLSFPGNNMYYASGNNGAIQKLSTFQDQVYCLQEHGFSQLDFNSKALIDTDNANPISITSIEGTRLTHNTYLSDNIGTQNKWSVITSKYGIYFVDDTLQSIYRFSANGIEDLSQSYSFKTWTKLNTTTIDSTWNPINWNKSLVSSYDLSNNDVYFTNKDHSLCFSESLDSFTSFYSYNEIPYMMSYKDKFFAIKNDNLNTAYLYQNHENYSKLLFNEPFDSYVELLVNTDLLYDKVFNFIEYYNDVYTFDNYLIPNHRSYNYIKVYNEYQDSGEIQTDMLSKQKFRLWKTQIPRHNFPNSRDRIRGAWCKIRLINKPRVDDVFRDQLHLISVNYTLPDQPLKQSFSEN